MAAGWPCRRIQREADTRTGIKRKVSQLTSGLCDVAHRRLYVRPPSPDCTRKAHNPYSVVKDTIRVLVYPKHTRGYNNVS